MNLIQQLVKEEVSKLSEKEKRKILHDLENDSDNMNEGNVDKIKNNLI